MTTKNKVTNQQQAHLSKLKNKRQQLENLLRSRERLDFEIKNLKKSISKDQKRVQKEAAQLREAQSQALEQNLLQTPEGLRVLQEMVGLEDDEDLGQFETAVLAQINELEEITSLLLKFSEPG